MYQPLSDSVSDHNEWKDLMFQIQILSTGLDKSKLGPRCVEVKCDGKMLISCASLFNRVMALLTSVARILTNSS